MKKTRIILLALILVGQVGILILHRQERQRWAEQEARIKQIERDIGPPIPPR